MGNGGPTLPLNGAAGNIDSSLSRLQPTLKTHGCTRSLRSSKRPTIAAPPRDSIQARTCRGFPPFPENLVEEKSKEWFYKGTEIAIENLEEREADEMLLETVEFQRREENQATMRSPHGKVILVGASYVHEAVWDAIEAGDSEEGLLADLKEHIDGLKMRERERTEHSNSEPCNPTTASERRIRARVRPGHGQLSVSATQSTQQCPQSKRRHEQKMQQIPGGYTNTKLQLANCNPRTLRSHQGSVTVCMRGPIKH